MDRVRGTPTQFLKMNERTKRLQDSV